MVGGSSPSGPTSLRSQRSGERRLSRRSHRSVSDNAKADGFFAARLRLGMPATEPFQYVYILKSEQGSHYYIGCTHDLAARLKKHNAGGSPHTAKHHPWLIHNFIKPPYPASEYGSVCGQFLRPAGEPFANRAGRGRFVRHRPMPGRCRERCGACHNVR